MGISKAVSTSLFLFFVASFFQAIAAEIPDRIDIEEYGSILGEKQKASSAARTASNAKNATYLSRVREREGLESDQARVQQVIDLNDTTISGLDESNLSLTKQVNATRTNIQKNETRRADLLAEIGRLDASIGLAEGRVQRQQKAAEDASKSVTTAAASVKESEEDLAKVRGKLKELQGSLEAAEKEVDARAEELIRLERRILRLGNKKQDYEDELTTLGRRKKDLVERIRVAADKCTTLQGHIATAQNKKNQLAKRVETLKQSLQTKSNEIERAKQDVRRLGTEITQAEAKATQSAVQVQAANDALEDLDLERERLEESNKLLNGEIGNLETDESQAKQRVSALEVKIAAAEGEEKAALQKQLKPLQDRLSEVQKDLGDKRKSYQDQRKKLLEIPGQKVTAKRNLRKLERQNQQDKDAVTDKKQERRKAVEAKEKAETEHAQMLAEKPQKVRELAQAEADLKDLNAKNKMAEDDLQRMQRRQKIIGQRERSIAKLQSVLKKAYRILEIEGIPTVKRDLARAETAVDDLEDSQDTLTRRERTLVRELGGYKESLASAGAAKKREQEALGRVRGELEGLNTKRNSASSERAGLLPKNQELKKKITSLEGTVKTQTERRNALAEKNKELKTEVGAIGKKIATAKTVEAVAKGAYKTADTTASGLEQATEVARKEYQTRLTNYQTDKGTAVAAAVAKANENGAKEGKQRGETDARPKGETAGQTAGDKEGKEKGQKRDYDAALLVARAALVKSTVESKKLETPAQKIERDLDSELGDAFSLGQGRGEKQGTVAGKNAGDSKEQETAGYKKGYGEGVAKANKEAEERFKPVAAKAKEESILKAAPKHTEERDASEENVDTEGLRGSLDNWKSWFANIGDKLSDWLIPSVTADTRLGEIRASDVPKVKFLFPAPKVNYAHPDFNEAYNTAYKKAYEAKYIESYQKFHKHFYTEEWRKAYGVAETAALSKTYEQSKSDGKERGEELGTFEGLGYNGGFAKNFEVEKAKAGKVAFERGLGVGRTKGYEENFAKAKADAEAAGVAEVERDYRNNVKLVWIKDSASLKDKGADGKFEIGETVSLSGKLRNYGGVDAEEGKVSLHVDRNSLKGLKLDDASVTLGEMPAETEVAYKNLITGKVTASGEIQALVKVRYDGVEIGRFTLRHSIHAPYRVVYTDFYDPKKSMNVGGVGNGSGYHNAVWVTGLGGSDKETAELIKDLEIKMVPVDKSVASYSWEGGGNANGFVRIQPSSGAWLKRGIFVYAHKRRGLKDNQFRVQLRKRSTGKIVYEKVVDAPVEVR